MTIPQDRLSVCACENPHVCCSNPRFCCLLFFGKIRFLMVKSRVFMSTSHFFCVFMSTPHFFWQNPMFSYPDPRKSPKMFASRTPGCNASWRKCFRTSFFKPAMPKDSLWRLNDDGNGVVRKWDIPLNSLNVQFLYKK